MNKTQGIILRATDYKNSDKLLNVMTPYGIITLVARGVRKTSAKLKAYAAIFTFGEFTYNESKIGKVLSGVECTDNFFPCWKELGKNIAAVFCFELTEKCFRNDEETTEEFVFLLKIMNEIAYGELAPTACCLKFAVFCAERTGTDYTSVSESEKSVYEVLRAFSQAEIEELQTLQYEISEVYVALNRVCALLKNNLGIRINSQRNLMPAL